MIRPFSESLAFSAKHGQQTREDERVYVLNPCDRLTRVFPTFLTSNVEGALMSYHSEEE